MIWRNIQWHKASCGLSKTAGLLVRVLLHTVCDSVSGRVTIRFVSLMYWVVTIWSVGASTKWCLTCDHWTRDQTAQTYVDRRDLWCIAVVFFDDWGLALMLAWRLGDEHSSGKGKVQLWRMLQRCLRALWLLLSNYQLPALTDSWTRGAASRHTTAPDNRTWPSPLEDLHIK